MVDDVFAALSDPTRRYLYSQLAQSGPLTATVLASDMAISRQAVAKHLGVLSDAGMATQARVGRESRYEASLAPLAEVQEWIQSLEGEWSARIGALAAAIAKNDLDSEQRWASRPWG